MEDDIRSRLDAIQASENVCIVYACESGSRAWGFPSADSDYDVRFIYVRPVEWYLSIDEKRCLELIFKGIRQSWTAKDGLL